MEIADMATTPATQGGPVPSVPIGDGALISDDDDDSFVSNDTESEGDFGVGVGGNADDNDDIGPEVNMLEDRVMINPNEAHYLLLEVTK